MQNKTTKIFLLLMLANGGLICFLKSLPVSRHSAPLSIEVAAPLQPSYSSHSSYRSHLPQTQETTYRTAPAAPTHTLDELRAWSQQNPDAALAWAEQQPDSPERRTVLTHVSFQIAESDPARAVALAEHFQLGENGGAVLENLAQQWAVKDLTAAYSWAHEKPAGELRNESFARIAVVWATSHPADAAQFVTEQIPPGGTQIEAAMSVLHRWALQDFDSAREWVARFPEGTLRERAENELAGISTRSLVLAATPNHFQ